MSSKYVLVRKPMLHVMPGTFIHVAGVKAPLQHTTSRRSDRRSTIGIVASKCQRTFCNGATENVCRMSFLLFEMWRAKRLRLYSLCTGCSANREECQRAILCIDHYNDIRPRCPNIKIDVHFFVGVRTGLVHFTICNCDIVDNETKVFQSTKSNETRLCIWSGCRRSNERTKFVSSGNYWRQQLQWIGMMFKSFVCFLFFFWLLRFL